MTQNNYTLKNQILQLKIPIRIKRATKIIKTRNIYTFIVTKFVINFLKKRWLPDKVD